MTTGRPTPRLSERLNADLEALRQENAALTASQLQSFRTDLTAIAAHARTTIEADTLTFLNWTSAIMQSFRQQTTRWMAWSAIILMATATTAVLILVVLSWFWSVMLSRSEMARLGLQRIDQGTSTFILTDPTRSSLQTCEIGDQISVLCIQISEK